MNGRMYGNFELTFCAERNTTLHVMAVGSSEDIHGLDMEGINMNTK